MNKKVQAELTAEVANGDGALSYAQCITEVDASEQTGAAFRVASEFLAKRDSALAACPMDEEDCITLSSAELDMILDPIDAEFIATSIVPQPIDTDFVLPKHVAGATYATQHQEAGSMEILGHNVEMNEVPAPEGWYFQQFVNGHPRGGYHGPYTDVSAMPDYVTTNPLN